MDSPERYKEAYSNISEPFNFFCVYSPRQKKCSSLLSSSELSLVSLELLLDCVSVSNGTFCFGQQANLFVRDFRDFPTAF